MGECEVFEDEVNVLELKEIDDCYMDKFGTLDSSEKTVAILGDR